MPEIPAGLRYTSDHLWVRRVTDGQVRVGVTDFAQQSLGDVAEVTLPQPGDAIAADAACGDIGSVKSVSDLIAPVTGTVSASNEALAAQPELVNSDPYGGGWMFDAEAATAPLDQQLATLLDADVYRSLTEAS
jgi:glycine cleavage system H protein